MFAQWVDEMEFEPFYKDDSFLSSLSVLKASLPYLTIASAFCLNLFLVSCSSVLSASQHYSTITSALKTKKCLQFWDVRLARLALGC